MDPMSAKQEFEKLTIRMSEPTKLGHEAALELFRFATEQLIKSIYPKITAKRAAYRALLLARAVLKTFDTNVESNSEQEAITPPQPDLASAPSPRPPSSSPTAQTQP